VTLAAHLVSNGVVELAGKTRAEVLREMADILGRSPAVEDADALYNAVLEREKIVSTGIGFGIAIPHAKIAQVRDFCIAIGISRTGVLYPSIDDSLVRILVMIGGPEADQGRYLKLLAKVQRFLKEERDRILRAPDADHVRELLDKY